MTKHLSEVALAPWLLKNGLTPKNQGTYVPRSEKQSEEKQSEEGQSEECLLGEKCCSGRSLG